MPASRTQDASGLAPQEWLFFGLVILGWSLFVIALGKDMSWDFRNYHWYAPYAFLNGRMGFDVAVAHQATYYNPLLDIPFYWLASHTTSWFALGVLGAVQGANVVPLYLIARALLRFEERKATAVALTLLCMTGGLTLSLSGTTYYDNVMSLFVLTSLAVLILRHDTLSTGSLRHAALLSAAAGLITGSAAGLKLPEAPYALGFAAALMALPGDLKRHGVRLLAGGVAGVAGVALFSGFWFAKLDALTGNPLFPYFNQFFHSPLALAASYRDVRFLPHDWLHALLDPILFSIDWRVANDLPFTDIRVGVAYVVLIATGAMWLLRKRTDDPLTEPAGTRVLFAFAAVTYIAWLGVFAIYRYILTLEMLAPLVIVAGVGRWPLARAMRLVVLGGLAVAVLATTRADFLKRAPLGDPYIQVTMPAIAHPGDSMILMAGEAPMGYLVPSFPQRIPFIRIDGWLIQPRDGSRMTARTRARVDAFRGDLYLLANPYEINRARAALAAYGLAFRTDECRDIEANLGGPYSFCPLFRKPKAAP
jgi:hypothetical protein